jgi:hypothetical protein
MLTLTNPIASVTAVAGPRVRVRLAAPAHSLFARFLTMLMRTLGGMHA